MDALRKACAGIGFKDAETYIQSGNVLFSFKKTDPKKISSLLQAAIKKEFGFEVPVITLAQEALLKIVRGNVFANDKTKEEKFLHVTFLGETPAAADVAKLGDGNYGREEFRVSANAVYLYCPEGYGNAKLTNAFLEKKLGVSATTRNWRTTLNLLALSKGV